jgi:hypothetical protein
MLGTIRNRIQFKLILLALLALPSFFTSCATKKDTALINDPTDRKETSLPWNEQQKWEREGEASVMNQQHR